jgi:hypothetical protein
MLNQMSFVSGVVTKGESFMAGQPPRYVTSYQVEYREDATDEWQTAKTGSDFSVTVR